MEQNKIHILHTRRGEMQAGSADAKHIVFETVPFIRVVLAEDETFIDRTDELMLQAQIVVFTSANAVRSVARYKHSSVPPWKIYCLSGATKVALEAAFGGDGIVAVAESAHALAHVIVNNDSIQRVIFFCGNKRRDELPSVLRRHDIAVEELVAYMTIATPQKLEKQYDGISFFSASAVDSFFSVNTAGDSAVLFAIGETTAAAIRKYTQHNRIIVCEEPAAAAMHQLIIHTFKTGTVAAG
jgi:uroporphyrinogen-III synthase